MEEVAHIINENHNKGPYIKRALCGKQVNTTLFNFETLSEAFECTTSKTVKICPHCIDAAIAQLLKAK